MIKTEYKHSDLTEAIIGAAMEVHSQLGCGFPEIIYQRALAIEFKIREIPFDQEPELPIFYKSELIGKRRTDFLAHEIIPVELKAKSELDDLNLAQGINYLEAFNLEIGLLINFGARSLQFKRLKNSKFKPE